MSPAWLVLLAVTAAGPGTLDGERVARALPGAVLERLTQGLPPPPTSVVRVTERYGTVTLDHQRHLELRASCRRCHGPGPISTIQFTARTAHERCLGCHQERAAGPVHCAGCHVKTVPGDGPARLVLEAPRPATPPVPAATAELARAPPPSASPSPSASPPPPAVPTTPIAEAPAPAPPRAARSSEVEAVADADTPSPDLIGALADPRVEAGLAAGPGLGFSLRVSSHGGRLARAYSFDRVGRPGSNRMFGLLGVGLAFPLRERAALVALAVGGFDAEERPRLGLAASAGARVGVEWAPPPAFLVRSLSLSVTAVADLTSLAMIGHHRGGGRVFVTLGLGLTPPARRPSARGRRG